MASTIFTLNPAYMNEGTASVGSIWRTNDMTQAESLVLYFKNGSALGGVDFASTPVYVNFEPGQAAASYTVQSFEDTQVEGTESFSLGLYRAGGGPELATTTITIADNDAAADPTDFVQSVPSTRPGSPASYTNPQTPGLNVNGNTVNSGNTNSYNTTNVTNNYYTDNSTNYNNSFNTDNSVNTFSLSSVTSSNDYSIGKTINGSGQLSGTDANDLITGGSKADRLYGDLGNDELIGGSGKDGLYGGLGSNVFNAGASSSKADADRLYIQREGTANTADIIESIGKSDRVYLQGSTSNLSVRGIDGGLGIFDNDILQAIYTGNALNASQLSSQLVAA